MKKLSLTFFGILMAFLSASLLQAATPEKPKITPVDEGALSPPSSRGVLSKDDQHIYIYGGPGTLTGKFQTEAGEPDPQGWTTRDFTAPLDDPDAFRIDTFYCGNLDPGTPNNHAYWCGDYYPACSPEEDPGGYGDNINTGLEWEYLVNDPLEVTHGTIDFTLNHYLENGYDILYVERYSAQYNQWWQLAEYTGAGYGLNKRVAFALSPNDYDEGRARLRFRVQSDEGVSSVDCWMGNIGACQIDNIQVSIYVDSELVPQGPMETCEPGQPQNWVPVVYQPIGIVGDFAQVWPQLDEIETETPNTTARWAFIDDGVVIPELPGYTNGFSYGPGGFCVNAGGGLAGPDHAIDNMAISPPLAIPDGGWTEMYFEYEEYRHQIAEGFRFPVLSHWKVRSTPDPTGNSGWTDWVNNGIANYGSPALINHQIEITPYIVENATYLQVAFGVMQHVYSSINTFSSPAPYFDNAAVLLVTRSLDGPFISIEPEFTPGLSNTLSWSDESDAGATSYFIECAKDEDFNDLVAGSGWISELLYEFSGLQNGNTYFYRVKFTTELLAVSDWSATVTSTQDATTPSSSAGPLTRYQGGFSFEVPFTATDEISRVSSVELFYSSNGGEYFSFGSFNQSPIDFVATNAGKFEFYTTATDVAGNLENPPVGPDAVTKVLQAESLPGEPGGLKNGDESIAPVFALHRNMPNPFNPVTTISFSLPENQFVRLSIYGLDGREICSLVNETRGPGLHRVAWSGQNKQGLVVASGVYFCRLEAGNFKKIMKMTMMK